jgi:hypothetical protein
MCIAEQYTRKDKLMAARTVGDVYPLMNISNDNSANELDKNNSLLRVPPMSHSEHQSKHAADEDLNSESMWSASLSSKDHDADVHHEKMARSAVNTFSDGMPRHDSAAPKNTVQRSVHSMGESLATSYRDDFTDNSESLLDESADHKKSRSRRPSQPSVKM